MGEMSSSALATKSATEKESTTDHGYLVEVMSLQKIFQMEVMAVWQSDECKNSMEFLKTFSSKITSKKNLPDISVIVDNDGAMDFFRRYIIQVFENHSQMLQYTTLRQYIIFIKFIMALWNLSDKFDSLCGRMAKFEVHIHLIRLLGRVHSSQMLFVSKNIRYMIMSVVGILHNINDKVQYTRSKYREEHLVDYLMPLAALESEKELIRLKTGALLLLAFLVNENENSSLNANDDHIVYILDILKQTVESPTLYSKFYGYHCLEILQSLRHIASPDNNKKRLINNGVLLLLEVILQQDYERLYIDELIAGLELLWSLSFCRECLQALISEGSMLRLRVDILSTSANQNILLSTKGILRNIDTQLYQGNEYFSIEEAESPNVNGHVMISYNHVTQDIMIKIKDELVANGYNVWMDVDHMRGSFVDAMADGIQHAAALLIGMCQAFKNSPHCRQEVKYAYTLGIPLVPVMLEDGFIPDGWLGLMCATLIYTEFVEPYQFDSKMLQLQRQLGHRGKVSNRSMTCAESSDMTSTPSCRSSHSRNSRDGVRSLRGSFSSQNISTSGVNLKSRLITNTKSEHSSTLNLFDQMFNKRYARAESDVALRKHSDQSRMDGSMYKLNLLDPPASNQTRFRVLNWTTTQCMMWLTENCIDPDAYGYPLTHLNGPLLFELAEMRLTAPKSYFIAVKEDLTLSFIDNLYLSGALRRLDETP